MYNCLLVQVCPGAKTVPLGKESGRDQEEGPWTTPEVLLPLVRPLRVTGCPHPTPRDRKGGAEEVLIARVVDGPPVTIV